MTHINIQKTIKTCSECPLLQINEHGYLCDTMTIYDGITDIEKEVYRGCPFNDAKLKQVKQSLSMYLTENDLAHLKYQITNIELNNDTLIIHCYLPGQLIGAKGTLIDNIMKYINRVTDSNLTIHFEESKIWR